MRDDIRFVSSHFAYAVAARDWSTAEAILSKNENGELYYFNTDAAIPVPCGALGIWLAYLQNGHLTIDGRFAAARKQIAQKVEADADDGTRILWALIKEMILRFIVFNPFDPMLTMSTFIGNVAPVNISFIFPWIEETPLPHGNLKKELLTAALIMRCTETERFDSSAMSFAFQGF